VVTRVNKGAALPLIIMMAVSSLLLVASASAQSILKPPVPEFAVNYIDNSYDVPPSYSTNPYTGENITHAGYHVDNRTIQITLVNSNFALSFGKLLFLYYNVQIKGHNVQNWIDLIPYVPNSPSGLIPQSDSQYTIISESVQSLPTNVPLDFRVQRFLVNQTSSFDIIGTSNWSNTQTITVGQSISTTTPNVPSSQNSATSATDQLGNQTDQTVSQPTQQISFYGIVVVAIAAFAVGVGLLVYVKKRRRGVRRT
jgi:hypothetical protein